MPVTQSQIDDMNAAIARGERRVSSGERSVEYHSIADLIRARDDLARQLAAQTAQRASPLIQIHHGGRGYD